MSSQLQGGGKAQRKINGRQETGRHSIKDVQRDCQAVHDVLAVFTLDERCCRKEWDPAVD